MDKFGNGKEIQLNLLGENTEMNFQTFTHTNFRHMCILSGCDYVNNVAGIGMVKAYKLVSKFRDPAKIFKALKLDTAVDFPPNYPEYFRRADLTFQHQTVYDPLKKKVTPLTPFPDKVDPRSMSFVGTLLDDELAQLVCTGVVDPNTHIHFEPSPNSNSEPIIEDGYRGILVRNIID